MTTTDSGDRAAGAHAFTMKMIDGTERPLSRYAGRALLVVNVASECGLTPQYAALEQLHRRFHARGLSILGVPCNQFGAQEPGTEQQIAAFCEKSYGVTFDLAAKVDVNGPSAHPLYAWLTGGGAKPIKWNFGKFLVGKDGALLQRFEPTVDPLSEDLVAAVERALA